MDGWVMVKSLRRRREEGGCIGREFALLLSPFFFGETEVINFPE